jgi:hypothetical protein
VLCFWLGLTSDKWNTLDRRNGSERKDGPVFSPNYGTNHSNLEDHTSVLVSIHSVDAKAPHDEICGPTANQHRP